ncbi:nuclear transport factor 2 family protein [Mesorhizobium sp. 131-2-5]|uniref:nuclear transport factor 2 family protein n=1 Tax=Mesorhizobium sp. 131-2-5 TaxID=2744519 RepID=UPI001FD4E81B|nr:MULTISPECIES: nuclear transport factor 2 family protein [Mesorhizobium]
MLKAPTRSDPRFLDAVLDDSMIEFGKSGFEYDKRSILAALTDSRNSQRPTIIWR